MIATILRLSLVALYGVPIARALDRRLRGAALAGVAFLLGSGAVALEMFCLSLVAVRWSRTAVAIAAIPLLLIAGWFAVRHRSHEAPRPYSRSAAILDAITIVPIIGHALFATWTGQYEWDFFGIWGLKGRTFFESGGIDWSFVTTNISHPDYPLLVPLMFDFHALVSGGWSEATLGLVVTAFCAALIAVARGTLRDEFGSPSVAAIGTLAIVFPALNLWIGLAEGIVMAFGCAGLIFVRRGVRFDDPAAFRVGAVLLGLAAWSKNEGLALIGISVAALVLSRRFRDALRLWPAVAVIAPWLIVRARLGLATDFVDEGIVGRMIGRVRDFRSTLSVFRQSPPDQPFFWIVFLICVAIYIRRAVTTERFLAAALFLQMALFIVQGIATRADLKAHVSLTMNRIPQQLAPACAFLAVVLVLPDLLALRRARALAAESDAVC